MPSSPLPNHCVGAIISIKLSLENMESSDWTQDTYSPTPPHILSVSFFISQTIQHMDLKLVGHSNISNHISSQDLLTCWIVHFYHNLLTMEIRAIHLLFCFLILFSLDGWSLTYLFPSSSQFQLKIKLFSFTRAV